MVLRAGFAALFDARFAGERFFAAGLRAADVRLAAPIDDLARVVFALRAAGLRLAEVLRFAAGLRLALALRAGAAARAGAASHLPDMTRCAASATASAINAPSFVALAATLLAACCAVSAASRPASRIAFRAFGLALIAAAAAASPAASISLLIAALAILSTVLLVFDDRDELFLAALAMLISLLDEDNLLP